MYVVSGDEDIKVINCHRVSPRLNSPVEWIDLGYLLPIS